MTKTSSELLTSIQRERGYLLSYHQVFARLDPAFMEAYDNLYRASLLEKRFLDARQRELIWVGIVTLAQEEVGEIHLRRAREAGATTEEIEATVMLAGIAAAWAPIAFAADRWPGYVPSGKERLYQRAVDMAGQPLEPNMIDLILLVLHGVRRDEHPFVFHLSRLLEAGVPEPSIAEAISYLLQPLGANTMLWATDAWLTALKDGRLAPSSRLAEGGMGDRAAESP